MTDLEMIQSFINTPFEEITQKISTLSKQSLLVNPQAKNNWEKLSIERKVQIAKFHIDSWHLIYNPFINTNELMHNKKIDDFLQENATQIQEPLITIITKLKVNDWPARNCGPFFS